MLASMHHPVLKELNPRQEAPERYSIPRRRINQNSKFFLHMSCVIFLDDFLHYGIEMSMVMLIANELQ